MAHPLTAELWLRGTARPVRARVSWPSASLDGAAPLVLWIPGAGGDDPLCRASCAGVPAVVLAIGAGRLPEAIEALEWAADHAAELGADAARLVVAGEGEGAAVAACLALHAHYAGWPAIARQVLVRPDLGLCPAPVAGVAPVTLAGADPEAAARYAGRLRDAGVEVELTAGADGIVRTAELA